KQPAAAPPYPRQQNRSESISPPSQKGRIPFSRCRANRTLQILRRTDLQKAKQKRLCSAKKTQEQSLFEF
ncbi:MAG: hypothetical protein K2M50_09730, partial [Treponemataceae bacterium]|nr:hypothetical protein [Treponemataceae bacterium]